MKVFVTGVGGQLGHDVMNELAKRGYEGIGSDLAEKYSGIQDGSAVTTTGGSYAKVVKNIVPFGPSFKGQKGIGHNPNEWMKMEDLITNAKIYALTLYHLGMLS